MPRYRKKPVVVEARLFDGSADCAMEIIVWILKGGGTARFYSDGGFHVMVDTLEGSMRAGEGWWVIRGTSGEFYPCAPEVFSAVYEWIPEGTWPIPVQAPLHGPKAN